jgi:hypothetical protein
MSLHHSEKPQARNASKKKRERKKKKEMPQYFILDHSQTSTTLDLEEDIIFIIQDSKQT